MLIVKGSEFVDIFSCSDQQFIVIFGALTFRDSVWINVRLLIVVSAVIKDIFQRLLKLMIGLSVLELGCALQIHKDHGWWIIYY